MLLQIIATVVAAANYYHLPVIFFSEKQCDVTGLKRLKFKLLLSHE